MLKYKFWVWLKYNIIFNIIIQKSWLWVGKPLLLLWLILFDKKVYGGTKLPSGTLTLKMALVSLFHVEIKYATSVVWFYWDTLIWNTNVYFLRHNNWCWKIDSKVKGDTSCTLAVDGAAGRTLGPPWTRVFRRGLGALTGRTVESSHTGSTHSCQPDAITVEPYNKHTEINTVISPTPLQ